MTYIDKTNNVNPADFNDDQDDINGVGDPGYIPNEPENDINVPSSDTTSVSSASGSNTGTRSSALSSAPAEKEEDSNYLSSLNLEEKMTEILQEFLSFTEEFNEADYLEQDENGFQSFKGDKWSKKYNRFRSLFSYVLLGNLVSQTKENMLLMMFEMIYEMKDLKGEKNKGDRYREEQAVKWIEDAYKKLNDSLEAVLNNIQQHNYTEYQKRVEKAEKYNDDWYEQLWNFISGGEQEKRKLEELQKASAQYKAATERTYQSLRGTLDTTVFSGLNDNISNQVNKALQNFNQTSLHNIGENGYIDLPQTKDSVMNIRAQLNAGLQAQNMFSMVRGNKQDLTDLVMADSYGVTLDNSAQRAGRRAVAEEANHTKQVFDRAAENAIQIAKLHNQENYLKKQLEKMGIMQVFNIFGNIFNLAGIILGALAMLLSWLPPLSAALAGAAVICSAIGGGLRYLGTAIADAAIQDKYKPSRLSHEAKPFDDSFVSPAESKAAFLESAADNYLEKITVKDEEDSYANLKKLKDKSLVLNYHYIASFQDTLKAIGNALRMLYEMKQSAAAVQDLVWSSFNVKKSSLSNEQLQDQNLENIISTNDLTAKQLVSNLQEVQQAYNSEIEQQKNMEKATINFFVSIGGAVVGGIAGGMLGGFAALGWSLGMALAGAGGAIFNAVGPDSAYGMTWDEEFSDVRFILAAREAQNSAQYEMMDNLERAIYADLAKNGITKTKDGYAILDNNLVADLYERLKRLANFISVVNSIHQTKEDLVNVILGQDGLSIKSSKRRNSQIYYSEIRRMLENFNNIKMFLGEKIRVQNAALDAEKEAQTAIVKGAVSTGVAALGLGLSLIQPISNLMLNLTPALVGLSNSLTDWIANWAWASNAPGQQDIAGPNRAIREVREGQTNLERVISQLDRQELQIYLDKSLLENVGAGRLGINAVFLSEAQNNLRKISTVREAIAQILDTQKQLMAEAGRLNGINITDNSALKDMIRVSQNLTNYIMESQYRAVKTAADNANRKLQYERAALSSFVNTLMQIAFIVLSIRQSMLQDSAKTLNKMKANARERNTLKHQKYTSDSKEVEIKKFNEFMLLEAVLLNVADGINKLATSLVFDEVRDKKSYKEENEGKISEEQKRAKASTGKGLANTLERLESISRALSLEASQSEYTLETVAVHAGRMKELFDLIQSQVESFMRDFGSYHKTKVDNFTHKAWVDKQRKKEEKNKTNIAAPMPNPGLVYTNPVVPPLAQIPQSTNLLSQYIEQLENRIKETKAVLAQSVASPADVAKARIPQKLDITALRQHIQKLKDKIDLIVKNIKLLQEELVQRKNEAVQMQNTMVRLKTEVENLKKEYLGLKAKNDPKAEQALKKYNEQLAKLVQLQAAEKDYAKKINGLLQKITAEIKELKSQRAELSQAQAAFNRLEKEKEKSSLTPKAAALSQRFKKPETIYDKYRFAQEESERILGHISSKNSLITGA